MKQLICISLLVFGAKAFTTRPISSFWTRNADFSLLASKDDNLMYLQSIGAITGKGEFANKQQKKSALQTVEALEEMQGELFSGTYDEAVNSTKIIGRWELVYSNTQLFRSSPFFMAGRAVCKTQEEADRYNWFCDMHRKALAISTIKSVRQIISESTLVSEFEVTTGAVPFLNDLTPFSYSGGLPVSIDGAIVSSADWTSCNNNTAMELYMDTVQIKGSNIPGLRQVLDGSFKLESRRLGDLLEDSMSGYRNPRPVFRTTYLEDRFRISRDQDDNVFLYVKTSSDTTPTDYSSVDADLGVAKLLEGFNDAITRFYL